jgi:hypothetical protein
MSDIPESKKLVQVEMPATHWAAVMTMLQIGIEVSVAPRIEELRRKGGDFDKLVESLEEGEALALSAPAIALGVITKAMHEAGEVTDEGNARLGIDALMKAAEESRQGRKEEAIPTKGKRKYITEFAVHSIGGPVLVTQQDYLEKLEETEQTKQQPFHIYMIARCPRIAIDVASLTIDDTKVSGRFLIQIQNEFTPYPFQLRNELGTSKVTFAADYPHNHLRVIDESGKEIANYRVAHLLRLCPSDMWKLLDLEVLYIGQSYGVEGARTAPARLLKHETLQAIYAQAILNSPDKDVWLLLWHFENQLLVSFDGRSKDIEKSLDEDTAHMHSVLGTEVSEQQRINYTEAALIRYFQPEFNKEYKDTFPNPAHTSYSECYDLDINSVCVEIDTEPIRTRLWTPTVSAAWQHFAEFNLHSPEERKGMFDYFGAGW